MQRSTILLPIHPEYAESILSGTKRFEFRKVRPRTGTTKLLLYATTPVRHVLGEAEILEVIVDEPHEVWVLAKEKAGINKKVFDHYFLGHTKAIAYRLGATQRYEHPRMLAELGIHFIPQGAVYL